MKKLRQQHIALLGVTSVCVVLILIDFRISSLKKRLADAIVRQDTAAVAAALRSGADPNGSTRRGQRRRGGPDDSMLLLAARTGVAENIRLLLKAGAQVNHTDSRGRTPLIIAIANSDVQATRFLLDAGADPTQEGTDPRDDTIKETPIQAVATQGYLAGKGGRARDRAKLPLQASAREIYRLLRARGVVPTPCQAIDVGDNAELKTLIKEGYDPNRGDQTHGTAMAIAVDLGNTVITDWLIHHGGDVNRGDDRHHSAVRVALDLSDVNALKRLLDSGADVTRLIRRGSQINATQLIDAGYDIAIYRCLRNRGIMPSLDTAIRYVDIDAIKAILRSDSGTNRQMMISGSALAAAVQTGNLTVLRLLLKSGADPNGGNGLAYAVELDRAEIVGLLLDSGASIKMAEQWRPGVSHAFTFSSSAAAKYLQLERVHSITQPIPLMSIAAGYNYKRVYEVLLRHNAPDTIFTAAAMGDIDRVRAFVNAKTSIDASNSMSYSPLTLAMMREHYELVQWILEHGADINCRSIGGQTPLIRAVRSGKRELVELLLAKGADVKAATDNGETALIFAVRQNDHVIEASLKRHGA